MDHCPLSIKHSEARSLRGLEKTSIKLFINLCRLKSLIILKYQRGYLQKGTVFILGKN